jgi:hypothetical protein
MTTTETTNATRTGCTATRVYRGKRCVVQITTPDGKTHELAGARAERAVAAIVFRVGEPEHDGHFAGFAAGWYAEGLRRTVYAAHGKAASMRKPIPAGHCGLNVLEARVVLVKDATA